MTFMFEPQAGGTASTSTSLTVTVTASIGIQLGKVLGVSISSEHSRKDMWMFTSQTNAPQHGDYFYKMGCRCVECRAAHNVYRRRSYEKFPFREKTAQVRKAHSEGETCRWCA